MQKSSFSFSAFALVLLVLSFAACKFNPNMQGRGADYLQGEWQQDTSALQKKLVNYSLYHLKFSCDSFFVSIKTISKVNPGADTCIKGGTYTEYAKGVYEHRNDTLHVRGLFCNANLTYKDPTGCFRSGVYEEYFKVVKQSDSLVQFNPTSSVVPINTRLIKRTTCNPKPL
jgi:hypothetical protein